MGFEEPSDLEAAEHEECCKAPQECWCLAKGGERSHKLSTFLIRFADVFIILFLVCLFFGSHHKGSAADDASMLAYDWLLSPFTLLLLQLKEQRSQTMHHQ